MRSRSCSTNDRPTSTDHRPPTNDQRRPQTKDEGRRTKDEGRPTQRKMKYEIRNTQHAIRNTQHLTYAELNRRANQLAHYLHSLGVGPEVRVGICMERSPELIIGILGILKAGGAYVPLDIAYPPERLAFMLDDA